MLNLKPDPSNLHEIYDQNEFDLYGFYTLERESDDVFFRWSYYSFRIKSKLHNTENICLFFDVLVNKKIFISSEKQKKEINLEVGENIIYIPITAFEEINVFIDPHLKFSNDSRENLGCKMRNVFISKQKNRYITLLEEDDDSEKQHSNNSALDFDAFLNKDFSEQGASLSFLDLERDPNEILYNPCLFKFDNKKYLSCRKDEIYPNGSIVSELKIFDYPSLKNINLKVKKELVNEQLQDCKFIEYKNKLIGTCATYRDILTDYFHQKWLIFDKSFKHERNVHPVYGKNGHTLFDNSGDEKNWTLFTHEDKLYFIYQMFPHTVVETDLEGKIKTEYITHRPLTWKYGEPRLTSNPIYKNGFFYSFFHSHLRVKSGPNSQRLYFCGIYKFKAEPPFEIVEFSKEPIVWGNKHRDHLRQRKQIYLPYCVFPSGAILENEKFLISLGINDQESAIMNMAYESKIS